MRILFICHGNICRSVAAEMVLRQLARERGLSDRLTVDSAAATSEEIGNGIYPPMRQALARRGIAMTDHRARKTTRADYDRWDLIIGMDEENLSDMRRIYGGDPSGRLSMLMDWAGEPGREVSDPWYTRDFDGALDDILRGCEGLLAALRRGRGGSAAP